MQVETRLRLRAALRNGNRLRWAAKARNLRGTTGRRLPASRRDWAYVLWDPEVGDFSYDLDDLDAAAAYLAESLGVDAALARRYLSESLEDGQLRGDYADCRRPTLLRRRMAIGQRSIWWAIIRIVKPGLIVETGVWYGLGSLVMLRALEANAADGAPEAELVSFDIDPTAGWLVPERLRSRWTLVIGATEDELATQLAGRQVDLFVHDTPSDYALERGEFEVARAHAAPGAILVSGNGTNTDALPDLAREYGLGYHHHPMAVSGHWYENPGMSLLVVPGVREDAPSDAPSPTT